MQDQEFINRKVDHLKIALDPESEASGLSMLDKVELIHDSLPDLNFSELDIRSRFFGESIQTPFFIPGMTAGHPDAQLINERLAQACETRGWVFGVGSQRREIDSAYQDTFLKNIRARYPSLNLIGNLGISQLIELDKKNQLEKLVELMSLMKANALAIHLNPLQEAIQKEGTPNFKGGMAALESLKNLFPKLPIVLKETGSGMGLSFLKRIKSLEFAAIDVSGLGGTHWGRVEGYRSEVGSLRHELGLTYHRWGVSTAQSILNAVEVLEDTQTEIWASGGIRTGLEGAKCLAIGAQRIGFAKPALQAALESEAALAAWMELKELELKTALFCTNSKSLSELNLTKIEGHL